jgi:hypothetical protein
MSQINNVSSSVASSVVGGNNNNNSNNFVPLNLSTILQNNQQSNIFNNNSFNNLNFNDTNNNAKNNNKSSNIIKNNLILKPTLNHSSPQQFNNSQMIGNNKILFNAIIN